MKTLNNRENVIGFISMFITIGLIGIACIIYIEKMKKYNPDNTKEPINQHTKPNVKAHWEGDKLIIEFK